ncbi:MAG: ABC transporter permease [Planctomycetota bacterium]
MRLLAISKNTFIETLRQPIYAVIIIFSLLLMLLAPAVSMYTLDEDIMLLRELGLSTLFLAGLFIAVFASTGAITEEIESGTITTVLSKPISRPTFVIGKFFGISMAVALAHLLITMAFLMIVRHGTLETASDEMDWTVITAAGAAILATLVITAFLNYVYDCNFPSTGIVLGTIFFGFGILFLVFVDREWKFNPAENNFEMFDIIASGLLLLALFALVALAILFSTRFNEVLTLTPDFLCWHLSARPHQRLGFRPLRRPAYLGQNRIDLNPKPTIFLGQRCDLRKRNRSGGLFAAGNHLFQPLHSRYSRLSRRLFPTTANWIIRLNL